MLKYHRPDVADRESLVRDVSYQDNEIQLLDHDHRGAGAGGVNFGRCRRLRKSIAKRTWISMSTASLGLRRRNSWGGFRPSTPLPRDVVASLDARSLRPKFPVTHARVAAS
jgi:hypothetical protein